MGRRFHFQCDSCGADVELKSLGLPQAWADVEISASGFTNWVAGGSKERSSSVLLCGHCQIKLAEILRDPKSWRSAP